MKDIITEPEIMERVDKLLRNGNRRRALEKAVQDLSNQKKLSLWPAIPIFFVSLLLTLMAFRRGVTAEIGGNTVLLDGCIMLGLAVLNLCAGLVVMRAYPKHRDKLLLMLAEEVLEKNDDPAKAAKKQADGG